MTGVTGVGLPPGTQLLVELSAAVAAREPARLDRALAAAVEEGVPHPEVEEALLQSYLFLGYPAALTAIARWREVAGAPPAEVDPLALPGALDAWVARGADVCRIVYGDAYEKLRRNVARAHPAMDRWMVTEGYGKVLGRPGLALAQRELCIVAILAATSWEPQLHSHLRGCLHAGATIAEVSEALEIGLVAASAERRASARELWRRVAAAHAPEATDVR